MAITFVDRQATYPNRYKVTREDGTFEYVTLERADEPLIMGTPLNAETFNGMISNLNGMISELSKAEHVHSASDITNGTFSTARIPTISMSKGGTSATNGSEGLKNLFAAGATVLSSHQYGDTLPTPGTTGRIFFKKVSG